MASFFLQMFKRGRYVSRRPLDVDVTEQGQEVAERERKECERFAVAAVAFCIEHHEAFKRHFLDVVAKLPPEAISKVTPEPKLHTDLVLEGNRHVLVLEFKIGAQLEEHQNPEKPAFWSEDGYGSKITKTFRQEYQNGKELRYIVVGKKFDGRRCENRHARNFERLNCSSILWPAFIAEGRCETGVENDLYDCLGHLGAPGFLHRHMKKLNLAREAKAGMTVYEFLEQVLSKMELLPGVAASDGITLGLNIKKTGGGSLRHKLVEAVQPEGQNLAWIGYSTWDAEFAYLSVGFYCSKQATEKKLRKKLVAMKDLGEVANDEGYMSVNRKREESTDDAEWFIKVLQAAAGS